MAPEILDGKQYNKSVDWWAVGIMLYELIFGRNPFNLANEDFSTEDFKEKIDQNNLIFPDKEKF